VDHIVMAAQYGLDTVKGDVDATIRTFGRVSGPIVLVGHSYGGTVITHAGMDPRVAALVYIAAVAPDETETSQSQQDKFPKTDVFKQIDVADGRVWLKPNTGVPCFAGDLSPEEQGVTSRRPSICSTRSLTASPGGRSRAGTSSPAPIAPSILTWSASLRSAWALPPWS
jgi:pimeloyl-ACP methyl ester carboxylesterase